MEVLSKLLLMYFQSFVPDHFAAILLSLLSKLLLKIKRYVKFLQCITIHKN